MRMFIFVGLFIFTGCAGNMSIINENCYKILWIDKSSLKDYYLFKAKAIKSNDITYIVSKHMQGGIGNDLGWVELKNGTIVNTDIRLADSLVILSGIRGHFPITLYDDEGELLLRSDTLVVKIFVTKDFRDLYVKKEKVGCK